MTVPRLRFAPSPTGYLHVGGARTALFNWLYARRTGGVFVLRIEDTDVERSSSDMVAGILDGMRWLGLDWDEGPDAGGAHGPYFQSQRLGRYREMAEQLVRDGHAYYCYCNADTSAVAPAPAGVSVDTWSPGSSFDSRVDSALAQDRSDPGKTDHEEGDTPRGESWTYDRRCSRLTPKEVAAREAAKMPRAIRFRVPLGETTFHDLVHGDITFDNAHIEDFVALRSDGHPTYHLSVVVDDVDMAITHVVRGDDHISNTPKQVLLYRAFGKALPAFAHVPLILGPDKRRLSKRHGATSVTEYSRQGFLPEAMMNFLALLGWSPGNDQELFGRDELVAAFSLEGISSSDAVFNPEKLEWFSAQHIARMPAAELVRRIEPRLREAGLWPAKWSPGASAPGEDEADAGRAWLARLIELLRPRAKRLTDFVEKGRTFLVDEVEYDAEAVKKHLSSPEALAHLAAVRELCAAAEPFTAAVLEPALRALADARGVKAAVLIHPTRVAVVGRAESPGIFDVLELVGRDRAVARMDACLGARSV
jgi:glutamyl-tRNA synthetase